MDSFDAALALFRSIGYKDYFTLRKQRWEYRWQDVGVFLEKIDNFGWAVELEVLAPASLADRMKQKLEAILGELGIPPDQYVTKSITNTMMRQHARFG